VEFAHGCAGISRGAGQQNVAETSSLLPCHSRPANTNFPPRQPAARRVL
jgi:hypothetical protein